MQYTCTCNVSRSGVVQIARQLVEGNVTLCYLRKCLQPLLKLELDSTLYNNSILFDYMQPGFVAFVEQFRKCACNLSHDTGAL